MKYGKQDISGKIVDVHTHSTGIAMYRMIRGKYPVTQDIVDLSETAKRNKVDFMVTFPMPTSVYYDAMKMRHEKLYVPSGVEDYPYQYENQSLVSLVRQLGLSNMLPFLSFSARDRITEQINNIRALSTEYDVYGLKYHGTMEQNGICCDAFERFAELAVELNIPIMLHSEVSSVAHPNDAIKFAKDHPNLRLCVAHAARMHRPFFELAKKSGLPNLFVDSAPLLRICKDVKSNTGGEDMMFNYSNPVDVLISLYNEIPDSLLWGTDMPWHRFFHDDGEMSTYSEEVELLAQSNLIDRISINTCNFLFGN